MQHVEMFVSACSGKHRPFCRCLDGIFGVGNGSEAGTDTHSACTTSTARGRGGVTGRITGRTVQSRPHFSQSDLDATASPPYAKLSRSGRALEPTTRSNCQSSTRR